MTETAELTIIITPEEKKIENISQITSFIKAAQTIAERAKEAKITDEGSLVIVDSIAKSAKKLKKDLNDKKLDITKEWRDNTSIVNSLVNRMLGPIEDAINSSTSKVVAYKEMLEREKQKKEAELRAKQLRLDNLTLSIETVIDQFQADLNKAKTLSDIGQLSTSYVSLENNNSWRNKNLEVAKEFPGMTERINEMIQKMIPIGKARRQEIEAMIAGDEAKAKEIENQRTKIADHVSQEVKADILSSDNTESVNISSELTMLSSQKTSGIRKDWIYEVTDLSKVPPQFMTIDDKAVKEYMKANKENLSKQPITGISFKERSNHVSR